MIDPIAFPDGTLSLPRGAEVSHVRQGEPITAYVDRETLETLEGLAGGGPGSDSIIRGPYSTGSVWVKANGTAVRFEAK